MKLVRWVYYNYKGEGPWQKYWPIEDYEPDEKDQVYWMKLGLFWYDKGLLDWHKLGEPE